MVSGVDPANRLFTNTRAPDGRDWTLILPTASATAGPLDAVALRDGVDRSEMLIAAVAR
jgi:hypothetical protein